MSGILDKWHMAETDNLKALIKELRAGCWEPGWRAADILETLIEPRKRQKDKK